MGGGRSGRGSNARSSKRHRFPSCPVRPSSQARRMISTPSSKSEGRFLLLNPRVSNSCCTYPCPTPSTNRPPEIRSATAASSATRKGWCIGRSSTFVPILIRSEEHTSELQSRQYLVCRLLLEKKKYS